MSSWVARSQSIFRCTAGERQTDCVGAIDIAPSQVEKVIASTASSTVQQLYPAPSPPSTASALRRCYPALNTTNIAAVNLGQQRQPLLRYSLFLADAADGIAERGESGMLPLS